MKEVFAYTSKTGRKCSLIWEDVTREVAMELSRGGTDGILGAGAWKGNLITRTEAQRAQGAPALRSPAHEEPALGRDKEVQRDGAWSHPETLTLGFEPWGHATGACVIVPGREPCGGRDMDLKEGAGWFDPG